MVHLSVASIRTFTLDCIIRYQFRLSNIIMNSMTKDRAPHHLLYLQPYTPDLISLCLTSCFAFFILLFKTGLKTILFCGSILYRYKRIQKMQDGGSHQVNLIIFPINETPPNFQAYVNEFHSKNFKNGHTVCQVPW